MLHRVQCACTLSEAEADAQSVGKRAHLYGYGGVETPATVGFLRSGTTSRAHLARFVTPANLRAEGTSGGGSLATWGTQASRRGHGPLCRRAIRTPFKTNARGDGISRPPLVSRRLARVRMRRLRQVG